MRSYFVVAATVTVVIISISSFAVEGRIGDNGVEVLRRMLQDEEATIDQAEEDDICKDKTPLPIPIGVNENLNCKKIKKEELCEEEYDGKYLYESCEKSCEICEDEYETTEAPTGDLLDVIVFDELGEPVFDPSAIEVDEEGNVIHVVEESAAPTLTPIAPLTEAPTESPSAYPTESPTTLAPTVIALLEVSEEPTSDALLELDFLTLSENIQDDLFQNEFHQDEDKVSAAPTQSPIAPFTDAPTESPSAYPTTPPTVNEFGAGGIFEGLDDDELLETLEDLQGGPPMEGI